jgi:hypothetical protein
MAQDDWRVRIEIAGGDGDGLGALVERFRHGLGVEARELADALADHHLAVSRDGNELFVYAGSQSHANDALAVVEAELDEHGITATVSGVEHWLEAEERWDNEPDDESWEEELEAKGFAPWEVRVTCSSRAEANALAERLEEEGYNPVRRWQYLIIGVESEPDAEALAERLHGEVAPGGGLVWSEAIDANVIRPFTIF